MFIAEKILVRNENSKAREIKVNLFGVKFSLTQDWQFSQALNLVENSIAEC